MKIIKITDPITNDVYERKIPEVSENRQDYYIHLILKSCAIRAIYTNLINEGKAHIESIDTKLGQMERYVLDIDDIYEYFKKENEIEKQAILDIDKIKYEIIKGKDE